MIQYAAPYSSHRLDLSQLIPLLASCSRPPHPSSFITSSLLLCSDSGTAVTPASPSHASAVRPPNSSLAVHSAGKVRYLAALTSWRGIYADDDSRCPLAILLLPPCRSLQSPDNDSIRIWLRLSLLLQLNRTSCLQRTSGSHLSLEGRNFLSFLSGKVCSQNRAKGRKRESSGLITLIFFGRLSGSTRCILACRSHCFCPVHLK